MGNRSLVGSVVRRVGYSPCLWAVAFRQFSAESGSFKLVSTLCCPLCGFACGVFTFAAASGFRGAGFGGTLGSEEGGEVYGTGS